jgi:hypothetical protein
MTLAYRAVAKRARRKGQKAKNERVEASEIRGGQFNTRALYRAIACALGANALGAATSMTLSGSNALATNYCTYSIAARFSSSLQSSLYAELNLNAECTTKISLILRLAPLSSVKSFLRDFQSISCFGDCVIW